MNSSAGDPRLDVGGAVRAGEALDVAAITAHLRAVGLDVDGVPVLTQFSGGASNWTYRLHYAQRDLILRRPPAGTKAKSAHDVVREAKLQRALQPVFPQVPNIVAIVDHDGVIGVPFYVMDRVAGIIPRRRFPRGVELDASTARQLCLNVIDTLVALHAAPVDDELAKFGRGAGYVQRQVDGWDERYQNACTFNVSKWSAVRQWLQDNVPKQERLCVVHNDWRFDNLVLDVEDPTKIIAVLDWELATIGDPWLELGSMLAYWVQADDDPFMKMTQRQPTTSPGMLTRREVVAYYEQRTGSVIPDWTFYEVFGLFRLATIAQQIYFRFHHGQTRNQAFKNFWVLVNVFAVRAWRLIR